MSPRPRHTRRDAPRRTRRWLGYPWAKRLGVTPGLSISQVIASLEGAPRGIRFELVGDLGRIRFQRRKGGRAYYLDFRPYGRVWSHRGIRITDEATARRVLEAIRSKVAEGRPLDEVIAEYLPSHAQPNLVPRWIARWLEVKQRESDAGDRSPTYLRELTRYAKAGGHFSWWNARSIHEISYGTLEDWGLWLSDRGLSPKTRRNVLGAFRSFLSWLQRREQIRQVPKFPWPRVDEYAPTVLSIEAQDLVLAKISDEGRGIFLAMATLGVRPGEARALDVADYRDGWLTVDKACKGPAGNAPIRGTKTGKPKRLPVGELLGAWLDRWVDPADRLTRAPLFLNPRTGRRWTHWALRDTWVRSARAAGLEGVKLYEGTKHSMATDAIRRGVSERALQSFLGHRDLRSTRRYAQLSDQALVSVPRRLFVGGLSVAPNTVEKPKQKQGDVVSPAGFEPALPA